VRDLLLGDFRIVQLDEPFIMREAADGENDWWPLVAARTGKRGEPQ